MTRGRRNTSSLHQHTLPAPPQIFVHLRSAAQPWPPVSAALRVRYEQTIGDIKTAVEVALGVPPDQQQLFW